MGAPAISIVLQANPVMVGHLYFFAEYVNAFGGHLDIVELEPANLFNCERITEDFRKSISYICGNGLKWLGKTDTTKYNLIFLDAGDDPKITLEMFELCDRSNTDILVDDFNGPGGKADLLKLKYTEYQLFQCNSVHQMALYTKING